MRRVSPEPILDLNADRRRCRIGGYGRNTGGRGGSRIHVKDKVMG